MATTKVLLLDNFDSFTYNIHHYLCACGAAVEVIRADAADLDQVERFAPSLIVLSPGPGQPENAASSLRVIDVFHQCFPIFGVCLGMQCLAVHFGGSVAQAPAPVHGKTSLVHHDGRGCFTGLPSPLVAGRYHSLAITRLPAGFIQAAQTDDGVPMAIRHTKLPLGGVQFHPESFLTGNGLAIIRNVIHGNI